MWQADTLSWQPAAAVAHALARPIRLQILDILRAEDGAYVMHLTAKLGRPQANVSQHLAILRKAGLVTAEREGMTVIYRISSPLVSELLDRLQQLSAASHLLDTAVKRPGSKRKVRKHKKMCGCPRCQSH